MKNIAAMINEKKRRLEGLQKIALWQKNVDGWRVLFFLSVFYKLKLQP